MKFVKQHVIKISFRSRPSRIFILCFFLFAALFLFLSPTKALADTMCWNGAAGGDFGTTSNWYDITTAGVAAAAPGSSDTAYFDPGGATCSTHGTNNSSVIAAGASINVAGINITSHYTSTLTQTTTATITVGASGWTQAAGTFTGGSGAISTSSLSITGTATFTATSGTLTDTGNFTFSGSSFTANGGTVVLQYAGGSPTVTGSTTFNNLTIKETQNANTTLTIAANTTLTVQGTLTLDSGSQVNNLVIANQTDSTSIIEAKGNINTLTLGVSGNVTILVDGTGAQTIAGDGTTNQNCLPSIKLKKTSGSLTFSNSIGIASDFTIDPSNTITPTVTGSTILFWYDSALGTSSSRTITGSFTFNNLTFRDEVNSNPTTTIASSTTLTVQGTLTLDGTGQSGNPNNDMILNQTDSTSLIEAQGDVDTIIHGCAGSVTVLVDGTGTQTIAGDGTTDENVIPNLKLKKTAGTLTFSNTISIDGSFTVDPTNTISPTVSGSTIFFGADDGGTYSISGSITLNNISFENGNNTGYTYNISSGTTITAAGALTLTSSANAKSVNGPGTITVQGNITSSSIGWGGSVAITLTGSGSQTINVTSSSFPTGTVTINKTSGTVTLGAALSLSGTGQNLTITSGKLDMSTFNLTVNGTLSDSGQLKQGAGTLNIGTLTVGSTGSYVGVGNGTLTVGSGGVTNNGYTRIDGTSVGCGDADGFTWNSSSSGTARSVAGTGRWRVFDAAIKDMNASPALTVYSSTSTSGNTGITFTAACPSEATWIGTTTSWNTASNWSGGAVPTSTVLAVFDDSSDNPSSVDVNADVLGVQMNLGYSGTITQTSTFTIQVEGSGWEQDAGTFTGGSGNITLNGTFSLTGGTYTATSGTITANNITWTVSGGTFSHNNGSVKFSNYNGPTITPGSSNYNNVEIDVNTNINLASNSTLTVIGTLTIGNTACCGIAGSISGGTISAQGNISLTSSAIIRGSTAITIAGSGTQTVTGVASGSSGDGSFANVTINKSGGSVTFKNYITVVFNYTIDSSNQGTITYDSSNTMEFQNDNGGASQSSIITPDSSVFNNVILNPNNELDIASGTTLIVGGSLTIENKNCCNVGTVINGPGLIEAEGNISMPSGSPLNGSVAITLSGTNNQTLTQSTTNWQSTGTVTINKSSGTVTLATALNLSGSGQDLLISSGTLNTSTFNLTVNDVLTIGGTLTQGSGTVNATTYLINSGGTWSNTSTGAIQVGSGGVTNYGTFNLGSLASCGGADSIAITSTTGGTAWTWTGPGQYNFYDITVTDQTDISTSQSPNGANIVAWSSTYGGNTNFNIQSGCPTPPESYWKFDEGQGSTAHDSSGQGNSGTITSATWQTPDQCVSGDCLYFNGSSATVTVSNSVSNVKTLSFWVRPMSNSSSMIDLDGGTHTITATSGTISANGFTSPTIYVNGVVSSTLTANRWQLVTITTSTSFNASAITMGKVSTTYFNGFLDEVKIYPYVRTSGLVQSDYTGLGGRVGGNLLGGESTSALNQGLVGYWKMDEASWNGTSGEVKDASGNGNNGTATGATDKPSTTTGKYGNAGNFDGTDDSVDAGSNSSLDDLINQGGGGMTVTAWIYPTSTSVSGDIVEKDLGASGWQFYQSSNVLRFHAGCTGGALLEGGDSSAAVLTANTWNFVTATWDGSCTGGVSLYVNSTNEKAAFGAQGLGSYISDASDDLVIGNTFSGKIDELRVYNRVLSPSEVSQLYNYAPGPVGYWKFDEGSGTSVTDSSGNANTGTWSGTLGSQWAVGKYGSSGNFNGSDNAVSMGQPTDLEATGAFTAEAWINLKSIAFNNNVVIGKGRQGNNGWALGYNSSGIPFMWAGNQTYTSSPVLSTNSWYHLAVVYIPSTSVTFYLNGISEGTFTSSVPATVDYAENFKVGSFTDGFGALANPTTGKIDEVRYYNYARTQKQIIEDMNASHPTGGSPVGSEVGFWKFDEGYGTTANNSGNGGSNDKGTLTNMASPATSTSGWQQNGKFGKALAFDGSNDRVDVTGNDTSLQITGDLTLSAWIKLSSNSVAQAIIAKDGAPGSSNRGYELYVDSSGKLHMSISQGGVLNVTGDGSTTLQTGTWYHVAGVYSAGNSITVYVNGLQDGQNTGVIPTSINNSSVDLEIGADNTNTLNSLQHQFDGLIDEAKVYSSALTSSEILADMNRNSSQVLGALSDSTSGNPINSTAAQYCIPGDNSTCSAPIGEWNFEEGSGTGVNDTSGNNNTGSWNGTGAKHWVSGKVGTAGNFNGSNDYVSVSNTISGIQTVGFWVYPASTSQYFLDLDGGTHYISASSGTVSATGFTSPTIYVNGAVNGTISANKWSYITVTTGTAVSGSSLTLGKAAITHFLSGKLDQVRFYNYARTPAQIAWDYNRGAPVAYWKMDECSGTTLNDSSGNINTGTINIGATTPQTTTGSCSTTNTAAAWYNGKTGKFNGSVNFDGTDDYVSIPDSSSLDVGGAFTISTWIYPTSIPTSGGSNRGGIFGTRLTNAAGSWQLEFGAASGGTDRIAISGVNSWIWESQDNAITLNAWNHVVYTRSSNSDTGTMYVNGVKLTANQTNAYTITDNTDAKQLGRGTLQGQYFPGQIDDVRLYNYALTAAQVQNLYNQSSSIRFGPNTGSP